MKQILILASCFLMNSILTASDEACLIIANNSKIRQNFGFIYKFGEAGHNPDLDIERLELEPGRFFKLTTCYLKGRNVFMRINPSNRYEHAIVDISPETDGVIFLDKFDHSIKPHTALVHSMFRPYRSDSDSSTSLEPSLP